MHDNKPFLIILDRILLIWQIKIILFLDLFQNQEKKISTKSSRTPIEVTAISYLSIAFNIYLVFETDKQNRHATYINQ